MKKMILAISSTLLIIAASLTTENLYAQDTHDAAMMKDCCMMQNGKMMSVKAGKAMPMKKSMTMKNGTKCMTNGKCVMKNGKKMQMKDGECMSMSGQMNDCSMMMKDDKTQAADKKVKEQMTVAYTCPMHPEVTSDKAGTCPKCGMDLVKKN